MSGRYYLTCSCGARHEVETAQAGETILCKCGAKLEVPTLVGLRRLPPVKESEDLLHSAQPRWSQAQAVVFVAGVLLALASLTFLAYASYRWLSVTGTEKQTFDDARFRQELDRMSPERVFEEWTKIPMALPEGMPPPYYLYQREVAAAWLMATIGGCVALLVSVGIASAAFFLAGRERVG
jgi:hypothetical protein